MFYLLSVYLSICCVLFISSDLPTTTTQAGLSALPPHWEERIDPASGKPFYLNHATKVTTWDRPQAQVTPPVPLVVATGTVVLVLVLVRGE